MVKRLLTLLFFLFLSASIYASHIVGGEFELLHVEGSTYTLNLILYFDNAGNAGAFDQNIDARIFRKSDNSTMFDVNIPSISRDRVEYFQVQCSLGEGVSNDKIIYSTTIQLSPENFNDPEGYYISWERCCRNYTISNIFSNDPNLGRMHSGLTFYLEFPAVVDENGEPFINSSPQLFPPLNDYGCPNLPYWVDFAGTDVDGDSLAYTLVNPLTTFNSVATPANGPGAGPYNTITWRPGHSLLNIMNGNPKLNVDSTGFLTVTPTLPGLYVFAVKCEEFRDGRKIGTLIRDFQMKVLDGCPTAVPPVIKAKKNEEINYVDTDILNVQFPNTVSDEDRCINIEVSDADATEIGLSESEDISLKVIALNFDQRSTNLNSVLPNVSQVALGSDGAPAHFDICFPECPFIDPIENTFLKIGVIVFDDACALPLSDTLIVSVRVIPPPNIAPEILANNSNLDVYPPPTTVYTQEAGSIVSIPIEGRDADGNDIMMRINSIGVFDMTKAGFRINNPPTGNFEVGPINSTFIWNLDCNDVDLDFSEGITISNPEEEIVKQYDFEVLLEDEDDCNFDREDRLDMSFKVRFPGEYEPNVFQVGKSEAADSLGYNYFLNEIINLDIRAKDGDTDNVNLRAVGSNFDLAEYGVNFVDKTNVPGTVTTPFSWSLDCNKFDLVELDSFRVFFITEDVDECNKLANMDTLSIDFLIDTPQNYAPTLFFNANNLIDNKVSSTIREEISVTVLANDIPQDSVFLELVAVNGDKDIDGYEFENVKGKGSVNSTLVWVPDCKYLNGISPGEYQFTFLARDARCPNPKESLITLGITINDIVSNIEITNPPNVFTPNGDGENPFFGMYELIDGELVNILPIDNCEGEFVSVNIYNRWGREVYSSTERDFKWKGEGMSTGVYFYQIKYTNRTYKGFVSILY